MALITLDNGLDHTRPNTFGPKSLASLNTAIDAALARDDVAAIGVTGKPFILAAGADLTGLTGLRGRDDALLIARLGHAVFRKLGEGGKPSFAFVNGLALGGGLEVALHCTYRTVQDSAPAARPARGDARPGPRLGRRLPGAEPRRRRHRREADPREPPQPGPHARRARRLRGRAGRRRVPGRRLPRAVAALGGPGADRRRRGRAARGRPGRGLGRGTSRRAAASRTPRPEAPPPRPTGRWT